MASSPPSAPPPAPTELQPPTEDEVNKYFFGLLSQPRLVARSDYITAPWTRPSFRSLSPVADASLMASWTAQREQIRDALVQCLDEHARNWTIFVPLTIEGHPYDATLYEWGAKRYDFPVPPYQEGIFLVVGVEPDTCSWTDGLAAANACRAVITSLIGREDIHVVIAELSLTGLCGGDDTAAQEENEEGGHEAEAEAEAGAETENEQETGGPVPENKGQSIWTLFNPLFNEVDTEMWLYRYRGFPEMQGINEYIASFLPFSGLAIQPVMSSDKKDKNDEEELPRGTLCCFMRFSNPDGSPMEGTYALTSRHVAIGDILPPSVNVAPSSPSQVAIPVSWGSNEFIADSLRDLKCELAKKDINLRPLLGKLYEGKLDTSTATEVQIAQNCVEKYIPSLIEELEHQCDGQGEGGGPNARRLGKVVFAGRHGHTRHNNWRDWALVAIRCHDDDPNRNNDTAPPTSSVQRDDNISPPPPSPSPLSNHVFFGDGLKNIDTEVSGAAAVRALRTAMDAVCFVKLRFPRPSEQGIALAYDNQPRYVFKRGAVSGLTMGRTSPIEAVVRKPQGGQRVAAWAMPILGMPAEVRRKFAPPVPFTWPGDSGSCVFDQHGTIVAMVDAGVGKEDTYKPFHHARHDMATGSEMLPVDDGIDDGDESVPAEHREPREYDGRLSTTTPISDEPSSFEPWVYTSGASTTCTKIDISLATPFAMILEDIEETTGLRARDLEDGIM